MVFDFNFLGVGLCNKIENHDWKSIVYYLKKIIIADKHQMNRSYLLFFWNDFVFKIELIKITQEKL